MYIKLLSTGACANINIREIMLISIISSASWTLHVVPYSGMPWLHVFRGYIGTSFRGSCGVFIICGKLDRRKWILNCITYFVVDLKIKKKLR